MGRSNPALYRDLKRGLCEDRARLYREHVTLASARSGSKKDSKRMGEIGRRLWVLNGMLEHDITWGMLTIIANKYEKIDAVPSHYFQPELFQEAVLVQQPPP